MKKVLIFTYYWPPAGGPGVQRFLKFSKYLREFGWEPIVITPKNGSYPYSDPSLSEDIPENMEIITTKTQEPFRLFNVITGKKGKVIPVAMSGIKGSKSPVKIFSLYIRANYFLPDARKGWVRFATRAAKKAIKKHNIEAIITTGPPHSSHFAGYKIKQKFDLPWLADFRDPWTQVYYNNFLPRTKKTREKDLRLESDILKSADFVTVISKGMLEEFQDRAKKIRIIYNGYDESDVKETDSVDKDYFILSYTGNLKPNQNIETLWLVLKDLILENENFKQSFRLKLTGNVDPGIKSMIVDNDLAGHVIFNDFVPHSEATEIMVSSNLLLFIIPQSENNRLIITGKIFEYLASKAPILSIGPMDGEASLILNQCKRDAMVDYSDKNGMKQLILHYFELWAQNPKLIKHQGVEHEQYSRMQQAGQLAKTLNDMI